MLGDRRPRVLVASVLDDKDAAGMLEALLPPFDQVVFTRCANPRALSPATLESLTAKLGGTAGAAPSPTRAAQCARRARSPGPEGAVVATGSIYLIADLVRADGARARVDLVRRRRRRDQWHLSRMDRGDGPRFGAMIGLVAFVVAAVILIFFGIGYRLGRLFL